MEELTASPLYHTVTIINSNIYSSGVSLQQTKEKILYPKINFFCWNVDYYLKEKDFIEKKSDAYR